MTTRGAWSREEVEATVAWYFAMLDAGLLGNTNGHAKPLPLVLHFYC
jgi:hypothetical protein